MSEKLDVMKKGFKTWRNLALPRVGIAATAITEDKLESLDLILEAAFEAGFSFGAATATRELMNDLVEAQNGNKNGNVVTNGGILVPDVGHA